MSFNGTKTPLKPTGKAKYQIPLRETPTSHGAKKYCLEGELKEKFIKLFPKNSNRRMMKWFGISFSTLRRLKTDLGLEKDMKAIKHQQAMDVKKVCEKNGYYDSLRGKPMPDACQEACKQLRASGFHPMRVIKERQPRRYKNILRRRSEARKKLMADEKRRLLYGLDQHTKLHVTLKPMNSSASSFKHLMKRKYNYFSIREHPWWICYDKHTDRRPRSEETAKKHGFIIVEGEDDPDE